ncbi:MAG TPA: alpha/beta hydrolase [Acidimicrobiales bacterium]|jgi:pimeloyl-ACP methyl ester carboxylesterase|nr:alpha/beta hydrolase [Acidimicrobiales bacterium]
MDDPTGAFADINGLRLYYEIHGSGRPLVLLHGGLLTIDFMFAPMLPTLAARGQVIAIELQGHGRTADAGRAMSFDLLADDVAALLAHLGIEQADVFGFSLGGLVGWSLVMRHPEVVGRFVVASADYRSRDADPDEVPGPMPTDADFQAMRAAYEAVAPDPSHFDALGQQVGTMVNNDYVGWTADDLRAMETPTLVLVGDRDFIRVTDAAEAADLLPYGQLAVLPGTTHMDMTRSPERLLAMVVPFLDG